MNVVIDILQVYRDCIQNTADAPYLSYKGNSGGVSQVKFCPYEDVLGVGAERGFSSILVPGKCSA
jgi:U3 small nucleolar RNA-associated protein 7